MDRAYAAADIVVSRSGGGTISELAHLKKPAVLIPLPGSPGNHQKANAEVLAGPGAAVLLEEGPGFSGSLCGAVRRLLEEPARLETMKLCFSKLELPDPLLAAVKLRKIIEKHTGG
jgi:UDP-N-acetylglucosamine--N-acetylmuramyl-(pentapeptide) pyrophosphoryl-undecaprenol N-acetylglucosamine transferase